MIQCTIEGCSRLKVLSTQLERMQQQESRELRKLQFEIETRENQRRLEEEKKAMAKAQAFVEAVIMPCQITCSIDYPLS